jgi:hypothetical protein
MGSLSHGISWQSKDGGDIVGEDASVNFREDVLVARSTSVASTTHLLLQ